MPIKRFYLILSKTKKIIDSSITHIRPRFRLEVPHSKEILLSRISALLQDPPDNITGRIVGDHIILDMKGADVHYWSPHLDFRVDQNEEDQDHATLIGLIGPRPTVWTLFMFIYFSVGLLGFFISSYGVSKLMINEYSHLVWAFPVAILFMLTAYKAGKYGEKLGADQVEDLKHFLRNAMKVG